MMTTIAQPQSTDTNSWRVVIERSGTHYSYLLRIDSQLPSSVVKDRILALYYQGKPWWSRWLCRPVIGVVTIIHVCQS